MPAEARTSTRPCGYRSAQLTDAGRPSYVVFLTDGLPTVGETNEMRIVANSKEFNKVHARIFCFGVGYDLNARFLDKLVRENYGQSEYVRPDENIEEHVARLYNRIESPVLTGMQIRYDLETAKTEKARPSTASIPGRRPTCLPASSWSWSAATKRRARPRSW